MFRVSPTSTAHREAVFQMQSLQIHDAEHLQGSGLGLHWLHTFHIIAPLPKIADRASVTCSFYLPTVNYTYVKYIQYYISSRMHPQFIVVQGHR